MKKLFKSNPFTKVNAQNVAVSVTSNVLGTAHFVLQAGADICKEAEAEAYYRIMKDHTVNHETGEITPKRVYKRYVKRVRNIGYIRDVQVIKLAVAVVETKLENAKAKLAHSINSVKDRLTTDTSDDVPNFGTLQ